MGEHQGEVGELTVVILIEKEHWVALSTGSSKTRKRKLVGAAMEGSSLLEVG